MPHRHTGSIFAKAPHQHAVVLDVGIRIAGWILLVGVELPALTQPLQRILQAGQQRQRRAAFEQLVADLGDGGMSVITQRPGGDDLFRVPAKLAGEHHIGQIALIRDQELSGAFVAFAGRRAKPPVSMSCE